MGSGKFTMEKFFNPPEKARLMFQAVIGFISENADLNSLKVQDITARAGVGKGTAYEYFSSKEELITLALLYDYGYKLMELQELLNTKTDFQSMMYCIMDWLHEHQSYHMTFVRILKINSVNQDLCEMLNSRLTGNLFDEMYKFMLDSGDGILETGYKEGLFAETDKVKRRLAFATMVIQVVLTQEPIPKKGQELFPMDYGQVRDYAYRTMLRTLS